MKEKSLTASLVRDLSLGQMRYTVAFTASLRYHPVAMTKKKKGKTRYENDDTNGTALTTTALTIIIII